MILFCFAGCAKKTGLEVKKEIGKEASEGAQTLAMYLMSEQPVSAKQEALMEQKVNEITEAKFKIHLDLRFFTPDQYYTVLDAHLAQMKAFYDGGAVGQTTHTPEYVDENGLPKVDYPSIEEFDVDLFYFGGYDKYLEYKNKGYLANLNEEINGSSKALKAVINSTLLNSFKTANADYYAVPTNRMIGEYKYLLLNKKVLAATQYSASDINSLFSDNCQDLLAMVDEYMSDEYVPLYSATGELDLENVKFFGGSQNGLLTTDFSVLAGTYDPNNKYGQMNAFAEMGNMLAADDDGYLTVKGQIEKLKEYEFNGYYATEAEADKPFAVGCIKGSLGVADQYAEDYEIVQIASPVIETNDLYESMFGVTKLSNSTAASMKIITYLNTNEEFRNLILYGVEGENYVWTDSDVLDANGNPYRVVQRLTKDAEDLYIMDPVKTGNVALAYYTAAEKKVEKTENAEEIKYPENPLENKNILEHNTGLKTDLVIGFSFYDGVNGETPKIDPDIHAAYVALNEFSAGIYKDILAAENDDQLGKVFQKIAEEFEKPALSALTSKVSGAKSHVEYYYGWLQSKGMYNPGP